MCDRGLLEIDPSYMKLEYCLCISNSTQNKTVEGLSRLTGEDIYFYSPVQGQYPEKNPGGTNTIVLNSKQQDSSKTYLRKFVANFSLKELHGCCGILVSYHTMIHPDYRGKGIANFLLEIKEDIARFNGYSVLLCTTTRDNAIEQHLLEKNGFTSNTKFDNKRTGNTVLMYSKILE